MSSRNTGLSKGIDWALVWIYAALVLVGLCSIFATEYHSGDNIVRGLFSTSTYYGKQFIFLIICIFLATFILLTDSKLFTATANLGYAFGILLLLLTFVIGKGVKGSHSWINFGFIGIQPAELCKVFTSLALAKYLSRTDTDFTKTRSQMVAAGIALLPAFITIAQNETGLALVYFALFLVMYREGLPVIIIIIGFSFAALVVATIVIEKNTLAIILIAISAFAAYILRRSIKRSKGILFTIAFICLGCVALQRFAVPYAFKNILKEYQVTRIYNAFGKENPYASGQRQAAAGTGKDGKGENYNVKQSKIAIGSGRFIGKGLLQGTQTRGDFVPEQRTDFIFCTIGEGFGFVGSFLLLCLYMVLLMRIVTIAERQRSVFSRVYAYSVASFIFFHITINVGMTIGLVPVIGIPLPLISSGGSSLFTFTILLFILIRLDADRQMVLR